MITFFSNFKLIGFSVFEDKDNTGFAEGIFENIVYNNSGFLQLENSLSGTYASNIFNAGTVSVWNNFSSQFSCFGNLANYLEVVDCISNYNPVGNILLYHFDSIHSILDGGSANNSAILYGGELVSNEFLNNSLYLSEGDYIKISNSDSLNFTNNFSVGFWINSSFNTWKYKRLISLSSPSPLENYSINLELTSENFNYSKVNLDGSDLRFYNITGTILPYWIEEWNVSGNSSIWINLLSEGCEEFLMYYGNPTAENLSDGDSTFNFFDDFTREEKNSSVSFGAINSVEYGPQTSDKLASAVEEYNSWNPDFVVELGDFLDVPELNNSEAISKLEEIEQVYNNLTMDRYYVFGNHDLESMSKEDFMNHTGKNEKYSSFDVGDYHFVILDQAYNSNNDSDDYSNGNFDYHIAYVPPQERTWLTQDLASTSKKTIIFIEYNLAPDSLGGSNHQVTNAAEVRNILEKDGDVLAVFTGHSGLNDKNTYNGIDYYRLKAMDSGDPTAYSKVTIFEDDTIQILGIGNQTSYGENTSYDLSEKWVISSGNWNVPDLNVLNSSSTTSNYARIWTKESFENYSFSFKELVSNSYTAPLFNLIDSSNYYYYHSVNNEIKKYFQSVASTLVGVLDINESNWHSFEIKSIGGNHSVFSEGVFLGSIVDISFLSGKIGFLTYSLGLGQQDNVYVRKISSIEPTLLLGNESFVGISKVGSFSLSSNSLGIYASLNDEILSASPQEGFNHLVLTYDSSLSTDQFKLYVNGKLNSSKNYSSQLQNNQRDIYLGDFLGFEGSLDEFFIFNRSISSDEVFAIYNIGGSKLNYFYRSCNVSNCSDSEFEEININFSSNSNFTDARYFQYKINFSSKFLDISPKVYNASIFYEVINVSDIPNATIISSSLSQHSILYTS